MKTVQGYLDLGLVFVDGDKGYKHIVESFAWRNNDGVKPKYNGAMKVELSSGDVIFNCGKTSEFDWRINDNVNPKILRWKPIVISDGMAGRGYRFAINECQKPSFLQYKPKINLIVPDSLKAEVRRVGSEVNVTISQKDKQENAVNNLEQVIGIDEVCDAVKQVSPKEDKPMSPSREPKAIFSTESTMFGDRLREVMEDYEVSGLDVSAITGKPMKPVYTAEMHARNELPQVGSKVKVCIEEAGFCLDGNDSKFEGKTVTVKAAFINKDESKVVAIESDKGSCACYIIECIKPIIKTIKVNGFDVPAPMSEAPEVGSVCFVASINNPAFFYSIYWATISCNKTALSRGLIHSTKSAAIAHAKAMLGIDPNA